MPVKEALVDGGGTAWGPCRAVIVLWAAADPVCDHDVCQSVEAGAVRLRTREAFFGREATRAVDEAPAI